MVVTDKGEDTRRRVVEVAARHFAESGYAGASLNDLIRDTGLTKGGFYFHFDSKESLALAVLDHLHESWHRQLLESLRPQPRAVDEIRVIVRALAEMKASHPEQAAIGRLCMELPRQAGLERHADHFRGWYAMTEQLLGRAREEGDLDPTIDLAAAARYVVGAFVGAEQLADIEGEGRMLRDLDAHISFSLRAVGARV
jgi:AcrR family transcriptional regulator